MPTTSETVIDCKVREILAQYWGKIAAQRVFFRGIPDGFSGSRVWAVQSEDAETWFLKEWPPAGPDLDRLRLIHMVLYRLNCLQSRGDFDLPRFAAPAVNLAGDTITRFESRLYDLSPKLDGAPIPPETVTAHDLKVGLQSLANTHLALNFLSFELAAYFPSSRGNGPSFGLANRLRWARKLVSDLGYFDHRITQAKLPGSITRKCEQILRYAVSPLRSLVEDLNPKLPDLPIQPCLRDVWYAHLLFIRSQVVGIIDFGSIGEDCVATDLARLLGSWSTENCRDYAGELDAYASVRPLSDLERASFCWFDRTSRVLSAFQWIEWLAIERREFDDWEAVAMRLEFVLARLPANGNSHRIIPA